eukprot:jgi/Chlat1/8894/Chrsp92S08206
MVDQAETRAAEAEPSEATAHKFKSVQGSRLLALGALVVGVLAGLPVWYYTTTVHRAPLPFDAIAALQSAVLAPSSPAAAAVQRLPCSVHVVSVLATSSTTQPVDENSTLGLLNTPGDKACQVTRSVVQGSALAEVFVLPSMEETDEALERLREGLKGGQYEVFVTNSCTANAQRGESVVLGKHRRAWVCVSNFEPETLTRVVPVIAHLMENNFAARGTDVELPLSSNASAVLSFSLLNAGPSDWLYGWDFAAIEATYLQPMLDALRPVATLEVESQVLFHTRTTVPMRWDASHGVFFVSHAELPFFINPNDWHMDTSLGTTGRGRLVHFLVYVPAADECPLKLQLPDDNLSSTNGFISPDFGGVVIHNAPNCSISSQAQNSSFAPRSLQILSAESMAETFAVIAAQIRTLLHLPAAPLSAVGGIRVAHVPAVDTAIAEWEVDVLSRQRVAADLNTAVETLTAFVSTVNDLPDLVILDSIAVQVTAALAAAHKAISAASRGCYDDAASHAREARFLSEEAFFHPSVMAMLYFPSEHKLAIYTPFFVPAAVPILAGIVRELKRRRAKRKAVSGPPPNKLKPS